MEKQSRQDTQLVDELRRRKVLRTTTIYAVLGWCLLQWCNILFENQGWPEWAMTLVLTAVVLGFPVMVALSWVFDITPDGVRRTVADDAPVRPSRAAGNIVTALVLLVFLITIGLLATR